MKDKVTRLMRRLGHRYALLGAALLVAAMLAALYVPLASAVTSTGGVINGCVQNATNASAKVLNLTVVREDGTDVCPSGYTKLSWNAQGIQGPKGDKGDPGEPGEQGEQGEPGAPGESGPAFTAETTPYTGPNIKDEFSSSTEILSKTVPAGNYAINAKVALENIDDDDVANADCDLRAGGTVVDQTVPVITLGINVGGQDLDQVANSQEIPLQATLKDFGGGAITINCDSFSNSDRVDATNATITAIKVGSVQ
jgi:hypothetical protein